MLFDLSGKVALVTGGNSGIGLGFAEGLAECGADVCIWGRNEEKNAAALEKLKGYGVKTEALRCDVTDEKEVVASFAKTIEIFGHVDSCFANAGVGGGGLPFESMTTEEWHRVFRPNVDGVMYTFREAVGHMKERGQGGSLVATSSVAALIGFQGREHYCATKAGIIALVQSLASGQARYGIRANAILPGWTDTPMTEPLFKAEEVRNRAIQRIPLQRFAQPSDYRGIAVYLASDASSYHTGDTIALDGGALHAY